MEIVQEERSSPGMGDLPESCIASILSLTTPRDVARLACVSTSFRDASYSDSVWQSMLPPLYEDILAQAPDAPASTCSKKEIYDYLTTPVLLENGTQDMWLDRATGGVCRSVGVRGLSIIWGDHQRYWGYVTRKGSRFAEVAYLKQVWWLEASGHFQCCLRPGTYTLSWRLYGNSEGVYDQAVKFGIEGPDIVPASIEVLMKDARTSSEAGLPRPWTWGRDGQWVELDVGEFNVESGDSPVEIRFSMMETDCEVCKSGMFLDSVIIRPTAVLTEQRVAVNPQGYQRYPWGPYGRLITGRSWRRTDWQAKIGPWS